MEKGNLNTLLKNREIAAIVKRALAATQPGRIASGPRAGKPSKTRFTIEPGVLKEAQERVHGLLHRFLVYPQLDLDFLLAHFG